MDELMRLARRHWLVFSAALPTSPEGDNGGGGGNAGGSGTGTGGGDPPRTFTQAEVDAMMTREKQQGKQAGAREIAEQLGVSVEDAKKIIAAEKTRQDAEKSEAQRAKDAADEAKRTADQEKASAAAERHATRVERALVRNGLAVPDKDGDEFITSAVRLISADVGADDATIKAAVDKLKTTVPALFGTAGQGGGHQSDPGRGPNGQQIRTGEFGKEGASEFERRFGKQKASA